MPETIGQRLKKAREYRNLTFEKVEDATHIRAQFLRALEEDDFSAMPSPVQARGFLRNYAQYLGLDLDQIVEELHAAHTEPEPEEVVYEDAQKTQPVSNAADQETTDGAESLEPFWQTWLRRVRQESGQAVDEPASASIPEPVSPVETESIPETETVQGGDPDTNETGPTSLWGALLSRANIHVGRKQENIQEDVGAIEEEIEPEPEHGPESPSEKSAELSRSSQEIINDIGLQLRQRREMLSLTFDEIERHTRMRAQFLKSLESGSFDELPSPVQTRGMLSNYAGFLDLDVDALLLQFAEALQAHHRERHPEGVSSKRKDANIPDSMPTLRSFIAGDMVFGVGVALLLIVFSVWGISRVVALQTAQGADLQVEATGPSISEALIGTPVEEAKSEVTLIPAEDTPIPDVPEGTVEIPTPDLTINVQVNVVAVERTFLRVLVDGEEVFNGRTIPGNVYSYEAEQSVELLAGNAAALRVVYNQRDLGLLGGFGQVASYIYTVDEILVPTPVIPPTATNTPFLSPTPSITPSPTPTSTPTEQAPADGVQ